MAELVTIEEARLICRVDGAENDDIIKPIMDAAEQYVLDYLGEVEDSADPRIKRVILALIQINFRPDDDSQGNLRRHVTALLKQMRTLP